MPDLRGAAQLCLSREGTPQNFPSLDSLAPLPCDLNGFHQAIRLIDPRTRVDDRNQPDVHPFNPFPLPDHGLSQDQDKGLGEEVGALLYFRIQQMMYFSPTDVAHKIHVKR